MRPITAVLLVFCLALLSCKSPAPVDNVPVGAFRYTGFDSTGALVVKGYFSLDIADSMHVTGEWHFAAVKSTQNIGPQVGTGQLVGQFTADGRLTLNLNPNMVDNNVFLVGALQERNYIGTWTFSGFPGVLNRGKFQAWR